MSHGLDVNLKGDFDSTAITLKAIAFSIRVYSLSAAS